MALSAKQRNLNNCSLFFLLFAASADSKISLGTQFPGSLLLADDNTSSNTCSSSISRHCGAQHTCTVQRIDIFIDTRCDQFSEYNTSLGTTPPPCPTYSPIDEEPLQRIPGCLAGEVRVVARIPSFAQCAHPCVVMCGCTNYGWQVGWDQPAV